MEALQALVPILGLAAIMTLLARQPRVAFVAFSLAGIALLSLGAWLHPVATTFYSGPLMASGFLSWVFPAAAAALFLLLAAWRRFGRPGFAAFLACVPVSMAVHFLGAWSA